MHSSRLFYPTDWRAKYIRRCVLTGSRCSTFAVVDYRFLYSLIYILVVFRYQKVITGALQLMAGLGMPFEVVDDKLNAGRGEEFSASRIVSVLRIETKYIRRPWWHSTWWGAPGACEGLFSACMFQRALAMVAEGETGAAAIWTWWRLFPSHQSPCRWRSGNIGPGHGQSWHGHHSRQQGLPDAAEDGLGRKGPWQKRGR